MDKYDARYNAGFGRFYLYQFHMFNTLDHVYE